MTLRPATLLAVGGALVVASCSTASSQEARTPQANKELADALAGYVAGPPQRCIPTYRADRVQVIDAWTVLYRDGRTIYVQNPRGGCPGLGRGETLVTRQIGPAELCDGDLIHTVDLITRMRSGSCTFGPFIPYRKPG